LTSATSLTWRDLETLAPGIARLGRRRLEATRIAMLGTLRPSGTPRISPVEPHLAAGHVVFGAMSWSLKAHDLQRDPRCVLHSAVTDPDSGEGELKLYGRASSAPDEIRDAPRAAWWIGRPRETASVFCLYIEQASFIAWDIAQAQMTIYHWSTRRGYRTTRRSYP